MTDEEETRQIAGRNDEFRHRGCSGSVRLSAAIHARGDLFALVARYTVQADDRFTPETDPMGRHDFGLVTVEGVPVCWRIDVREADRVLYLFTPPDA